MLTACIALGLSAVLSVPVAPAQQADPRAEFLEKWAEAARFSDSKAMEAALRKYTEVAIHEFMRRAEARASGNGDQALDDWVDSFVATWSAVYRTDFARNYDRFAQLMDADRRELRDKLISTDYPRLNEMHVQALVHKNEDVSWSVMRELADQVVEAMTSTGDLYYIALARNIQGNVWNPVFHEEGADPEKALAAYEACIKARDELGLKNDSFYSNTSGVLRDLKTAMGAHEEGAEGEGDEGDVGKLPRSFAPLVGASSSAGALVAGADAKPGAVVHTSDMSATNRFGWKRAGAGKVGESITLPDVVPNVQLNRLGDNSWTLEAGGEPSDDFRLSAKPVSVTVERKHADGSTDTWTALLAAGSSSDSFNGVTLNLQPSEGGGPVFFRAAATVRCETDFGELVIYDMDCDGQFGHEESLPLRWSEGLMEGMFFYRPDAITLGKMKHSRPFSRFIQDDKGQWYEIEVLQVGAKPGTAEVTPVTPKTGTLVLEFEGIKKVKPASILLVSDSSSTKGLVVDLATMKGPKYELPAGRYLLLQARFAGKGVEEVTMMPPPIGPLAIDVLEGETAELILGAPFELTASVELAGKEAIVAGRTLHIVGSQGERYLRFMGAPMYGIEASMKGVKAQTLRAPDSEEANADWERLFYPMDALIEAKKNLEEGATVIELELKKHPWFGKLKGRVEA